MKDYFLTLLIASVLGGVIAVLVSGNSFEKYIKYIAGLVCVVIIISPLKSFISGPFKLPDEYNNAVSTEASATGADEVIASVTVLKLDAYIKDILFSKFGIKAHSTDIKIDWVDNCLIINEVTVFLNESDSSRLTEVQKYLDETIDESVVVKVIEENA